MSSVTHSNPPHALVPAIPPLLASAPVSPAASTAAAVAAVVAVVAAAAAAAAAADDVAVAAPLTNLCLKTMARNILSSQ